MPLLTSTVARLITLQLAAVPPVPAAATALAPEAYSGASELAAEAPIPAWQPEGGGAAHRSDALPHVVNKKIRKARNVALAGGTIAVLGLATVAAGMVMYYVPRAQLTKLKQDNGGVLPPGDEGRQRAISAAEASPILMGVGAGVFVVGAVMAGVAGSRFKKLREEKRTTVAFAPLPMRTGGGLALEVRF
ncbi:MAG: hypothetical protein IAG13_19265 [Deltaproteobacteria bacterium]|nr:hypothetical protein [Nannocystaceae bacterium]